MTIPPDAHLHKPDINGTTVLLLKLSELSLCLIFRLSIERKPRTRSVQGQGLIEPLPLPDADSANATEYTRRGSRLYAFAALSKMVPLRSIAFAVDERRAADRTSALALFFISLPPYV